MRIFIAVKFDGNTLRYLDGLSRNVEEVYDNAGFTRISNLHITIFFIGEADRSRVNKTVSAVAETAASTKPFTLITDGISSFRRKNKHTVICRIKESRELSALHDRVIVTLENKGFEINEKEFRPHITLARQAEAIDGAKGTDVPAHSFDVNDICVMESSRVNGVLTYTPIAEFSLGGTKG